MIMEDVQQSTFLIFFNKNTRGLMLLNLIYLNTINLKFRLLKEKFSYINYSLCPLFIKLPNLNL